MSNLRSKFFPKFQTSPSTPSARTTTSADLGHDGKSKSRTSLLLGKARQSSLSTSPVTVESAVVDLPTTPSPVIESPVHSEQTPQTSLEEPREAPSDISLPKPIKNPLLTVEAPTPTPPVSKLKDEEDPLTKTNGGQVSSVVAEEVEPRPAELPRRQSLASGNQRKFLETLLETDRPDSASTSEGYFPKPVTASMLHRKIWVKRPGASATLILINEDDLVDDVRDRILKKYGNSLGRNFDAPDVTLRIVPREHRDHTRRQSHGERVLGPEEHMTRILDSLYAGEQTVDEALIIDVPRRTPSHSPRPMQYVVDNRPVESGTDYFPVIPPGQQSPHLPTNLSVSSGHAGSHHVPPHSISILNTGQVPALPSPGGTRTTRYTHRPKFNRQHTTSPSIHGALPSAQVHDTVKPHPNGIPVAPNIPSPSLPTQDHAVATPPPRPASPRIRGPQKSSKKSKADAPTGLLNGAVPPINCLIVEDNIINLKLLEAFMKRLKVRWATAMNGKEAVQKWRNGGFHLVLMDIQLPVMNGLDATKEIRRLERVNNIGAFSYDPTTPSTDSTVSDGGTPKDVEKEDDNLPNRSVFLSPVIIVALTASSLQSDRHEALAAGCNDFLTKPVNFVWLERKVMEWGCMQALIDFDGWRKWKDFSLPAPGTAGNATTGQPGKKLSPGNTRGNSSTPPTKSINANTTNNVMPSAGARGAATSPSPPAGKADAVIPRHKRISSGSWSKGTGVRALESIRADSKEDVQVEP